MLIMGKKFKLLIVDDDTELLETLQMGLDKKGYLVTIAESAEDAALLINNIPDVIIIDALLPKMNGFEFCKKVKETNSGKDIPIIIMTGVFKQHFQEKEAKLKYKASDYLLKPFTLEKLEEVIAVNLGLYQRGEITEEKLGFKSKGSIASVPVEKLLKNIGQAGKTGLLEIRKGKLLRRLYFHRGTLIYGLSNLRSDSFSEILMKKNKINNQQREKLDLYSKKKRLSKERVAVNMKFIQPEEAKVIQEETLKNIVFGLLRWKEGEYVLKLKEMPPKRALTVQLDIKKIVIQGILNYVRN